MRAVVQRVSRAEVRRAREVVARIGPGLLVLLGVGREDGEAEVRWLANRIVGLRVFDDERGRMHRSVCEVGGEVLVVSQFTLLADCRRGRRPSFDAAAPAPQAEVLYRRFIEELSARGVPVREGRFGEAMEVELVNQGPATFVVDSP